MSLSSQTERMAETKAKIGKIIPLFGEIKIKEIYLQFEVQIRRADNARRLKLERQSGVTMCKTRQNEKFRFCI